MRKTIILLISMALFPSLLFAEKPKSDIVLESIENNIRKAFSELKPELIFEHPQHTTSIVVKYKPQKFMVHSIYKTGRISEKAHESEGPSFEGFILKAHIEKKDTIHQSVVPQRINRIYWNTDLNHTVINNTHKQVCWSLSFGTRTDKEFLEKIKNIIIDIVK